MSENKELHTCILCEAPGARACARCRSCHYCSKECQLDDWPVHKLVCASFTKFDTSTRPSKDHFLGIMFGQDEARPRFTWLHCPSRLDDDTGMTWQHPDFEDVSGLGPTAASIPITTDALLQRRLDDTINLCYRDTFLVDGSRFNRSVEAVLATLPGPTHDWRGPMAVVGKKGLTIDPWDCRDLEVKEFRYVADYFISYGRWPLDIPDRNMTSGTTVQGVKINCVGDRQTFGKPQYELVAVSPDDAIFSGYWQDTSDIADRIGLPILTRRLPFSLSWAGPAETTRQKFDDVSPETNQEATFLHLCCDPKADGFPTGPVWGWAGPRWQNDVGSVLVIRRDRKPLAPMHVEALCTYCRYEVQPLVAHTLREYEPDEPLERGFVWKMICRPLFSIHWYKLCDRKREERVRDFAEFPYNV